MLNWVLVTGSTCFQLNFEGSNPVNFHINKPVIVFSFFVLLIISFMSGGCITLTKATEKCDINEISTLLAKGGDGNARDFAGRTPLFYAASCDNIEIIKLLVGAGVDVNAKDQYGNTPLFEAAKLGKIEAVNWLLENGADINVVNNCGLTALLYSAGCYLPGTLKNVDDMHRGIARLLLEKGDRNRNSKNALLILNPNICLLEVDRENIKNVDLKMHDCPRIIKLSSGFHILKVNQCESKIEGVEISFQMKDGNLYLVDRKTWVKHVSQGDQHHFSAEILQFN